jgi:endonuclease/exonuclease/phosphatase family metal-dependent hydrolase
VARALAALPVDLLCVQEIWLEAHWQKLRAATRERFPSVLRPAAARQFRAARCTEPEARAILQCARRHCGATSPSSLGLCVLRQCSELARGLSVGCAECLMANPLRSITETETECTRAGQPQRGANGSQDTGEPSAGRAPIAGPRAYVYGGSHGIALLTSAAIVQDDFLPLPSEQLARGVLYAKIRTDTTLGDVHVFCTHLTADLPGVPYPGASGSWRAEHALQMEPLIAWIDRKAKAPAASVLLGDLNTGPRIGAEIRARAAREYARLLARGFANPYAETSSPSCSFCSSNPLNGGSGRGGSLIDHVLVRGPVQANGVTRILDEAVELAVGSRTLSSALSDHYGIAATLRASSGAR